MSVAFKGLDALKEIVADMPNVTISTVSCELTSFAEGQFPVHRGFWEEQLIRLFDAYAPERDNSWREYGPDFENDVFRVLYDRQDGECTCGFVKLAEKWHEDNPESPDCYYTLQWNAIQKWDQEHGWDKAKGEEWHRLCGLRNRFERSMRKRLCERFGIPWDDGKGSAIHCTCGKKEKAKEWFSRPENDHKPPCVIWLMGLPNFFHKPSNYGVHWYKYPCRDAYGTEAMTPEGFAAIIDKCIESLVKHEVV